MNGSWIQIGDDIDGENGNDNSGRSVALSADGNVLAIGAVRNCGHGLNSGHVRVYRNVNGTWIQIGDDIDGQDAGDVSGWSVALSANGSVVAIGAPFNNDNGSKSGHVRVFQNMNGSWVQIGFDIDGENTGDEFGESVALSADGSVLAVGAVGNDANGSNSGHVRVFKLN